MKKKVLVMFLAATMLSQTVLPAMAGTVGGEMQETAVTAQADAETINCKEFLTDGRIFEGKETSRVEASAEELDFVKGLGSGTITATFKTSDTGLQALTAMNGSEHTNHYISLYIRYGNRIGFELRDQNGGNDHNFVDLSGINLADNEWHTISLVVSENEYYKLYLDKEMVYEKKVQTTHFVNKMGWEPTSLTFGGAKRISGDNYLFEGELKNVKIYDGALSENQIIKDHGGVEVADPILTYEKNSFDGTVDRMVEKNSDAAQLAGLQQGTVAMAYRLDASATTASIAGLFSVSNKDEAKQYSAMYLKPDTNSIGIETTDGGATVSALPAGSSMQDNKWHTVMYTFTGTEISIYWDGKLVTTKPYNGVFQPEAWTANAVTIGGIQRNDPNKWPFSGKINTVQIYDTALNAEQVAQLSDRIKPEDEDDTVAYPEGVVKTEEYGIYDMGDDDSFNYRIPALTTTADGTVIAAADQRNMHWSDWGNIDTVIRTSSDKGKTWGDVIDVLDLKSQPYDTGMQSAFAIDPVMVSDDKGSVWMMIDMFPESTGFGSAKKGTGYVKVDGKDYLALYDKDNNVYTVREEGYVYDSEGNKTAYQVNQDVTFDNAFHNIGDLYENGEYVGNIYLTSNGKGNDSAPMHVLVTSYLWLLHSEDNGKTWSKPVDITPQVKDEAMKFCGTGPGAGIILKNGEHKGRIILPIYYTENSGFQSSANVYSDDGGKTWKRGESPNDGRINNNGDITDSLHPVGIDQLTESQIIELNNGHLLQFMRNTGSGKGKVAVASSTDGGETWEDPYYTDATEVYCQLSVMHYPELVDGKECIVMSNPGGPGRNNGTLRIGTIDDKDNITWVNQKMFCPGGYAYSCLNYMGDGIIGLMYEHRNTIKFTSFNLDYITNTEDINILNPTITSMAYEVQKDGEHRYVLPGDTIMITVKLDQNVTVTGSPKLRLMLNGVGKYAEYVSGGEDDREIVFRYVVQEGDEGEASFKGPKIITDSENKAVNFAGYSVSSGDMDVSLGYIGVDPSDGENDISLDGVVATAGSAQTGEGPEKAIDRNTATLWHSAWAGTERDNLWIKLDFGKDWMMDGLRYMPRSSGQNGIITKYKIEVSQDDEHYTEVATGDWALDNTWKTVSFDPVRARYVRLSALESATDSSKNNYASATEIRVTGKEAGEEVVDKTKLDASVKAAEELLKDADKYMSDYVQKVNDGLKTAKDLQAKADAAQTDVDKAAEALDKLVKSPVEKGDKAALEAMVKELKDMDLSKYTEESVKALEKAVAKAEEALKAAEMTAADVEALTKELKDTKEALTEKPVAELPFDDITDSEDQAWFYDAVVNVYQKKLMTGLDEKTFAPYDMLSRSQFALILYRMEKEPDVTAKNEFPDVVDGIWYTDAIIWAKEAGVVTGYSDNGNFGPADNIDREQMVTMLYRYAKLKGYDTSKKADLSKYEDASSVTAFAQEAMEWAVGSGVIVGKFDETKLDPQGKTSRAECAIMLTRLTEIFE